MELKDKQYFVNVYNKISASVTTVNEKIVARQKGKASVEDLLATVALEQLAMQHETLIALAILVADPGSGADALPVVPKKIIGFN